MTISWFIAKLKSFSKKEAIVYDEKTFTYKELIDYYNVWKDVLINKNVQKGQVIAIEGDYSPKICSLIIALIENNNIIVPFSSTTQNQRDQLLEIATADKIFSIVNENFTLKNLQFSEKNDLIKKLISSNEPGLILFTSGSTGTPKGVVHNFTKLIDKYKKQRNSFRTLTFLLLAHIGGINTLFHTLANGGTIITSNSRKPKDICEVVQKYRVELLPASPSFLNLLLLTEQYKYYDMSSLKVISYGTEVMPDSTLKKLNASFPNVNLKQTYGLSELGIMSTKSKDSDSLWLKVGGEGFETKIIDNILYIRSESAMLGYLNAPTPFDDEGWFNTQDQVIVEGDYLRILGRKSEIINVGGQKVYPAEVEEVLLQLSGIKDVVVKGEPYPVMGNIVTAKVNLINDESIGLLKTRVNEFCKNKLESFKIPVKIEIVNDELFNSRFKRIRN